MKKLLSLVLCLAVIGLVAGCETNKTRVAEGAVIGGVVGATAGGIIGHQGHHGAEGAGIGAAAGALLGAVVGSQINKPGQTATPAGQQAPSTSQMSLQQIVDLTKQGVHEDVIIDKIRLTNSKYTLTADDVTYLKNNGVSQKIISVMQGA